MHGVLIVALLCVLQQAHGHELVARQSCTSSCCDYSGSVVLMPSVNFNFSWTVNCAAGTITATMAADTTGWLAVGFSTTPGMPNSDIILGYVDAGNTAQVTDRWATAKSVPPVDTQNDLTGISGTQTATRTSITFTRRLDTGDTTKDVAITNAPIYLLYAYRVDDTLAFHSSMGSTRMSLMQPTAIDNGGGTTPPNCGDRIGSQNFNLDASYRMDWVLSCATNSITVTLTVRTRGWIGWGLNTNDEMRNADIVMAYVDDATGAVIISDRWATGETNPVLDSARTGGRDDLRDVSGNQTSTTTTIQFTRYLNTSDPNDRVIQQGQMYVLHSYRNDDDTTRQHSDEDARTVTFMGAPNTVITTGVPVATTTGGGSTGGGSGGCVSTCCDNTGTYTAVMTNPVKLDWAVNCAAGTLTVALTGQTTGWVGFGVGADDLMPDTDIVIGYVDNSGTAFVVDRWATARAEPEPDTAQGGANDLTATSGNQTATATTITFTRPLAASDSRDYAISNQPVWVLLAYGDSDDLSMGHADRQAFRLDFMGGGVSSGTTGASSASTGNDVGSGEGECKSGSNSIQLLGGDTTFDWTIDCDAGTIAVKLSTKTTGWTGLGLNSAASMRNADIVMGFVADGVATVSDRWATTTAAPPLDTSQGGSSDITEISGSEVDGVTIIQYTRKLISSDSKDFSIIPGKKTILLHAYGTSDDVSGYHGAKRESLEIDLFSGTASVVTTTNWRGIHGSMMLIAWGLLAGVGQFLARFLKNIGHSWFLWHRTINYLVVILSFISFIIIVWHMNTFVVSAHHIIGLAVMLGALVQPVLGVLADKMWSPDRKGTPVFPDMLHWWIGRSSILLGLVNIGLGFCEYQVTKEVWVLYGIWLVIYLAAFIYTQIRTGSVHHNAGEASASDISLELQPPKTPEPATPPPPSVPRQIVGSVYAKLPPGCWSKNKVPLVPFIVMGVFGSALCAVMIILMIVVDERGECILPRV